MQSDFNGLMLLSMWFPQQPQKDHLGTCERCRFSSLTPDLLNEKAWGLLFICVFTNLTGDSDARSHLEATLPACEPKVVGAPSHVNELHVG